MFTADGTRAATPLHIVGLFAGGVCMDIAVIHRLYEAAKAAQGIQHLAVFAALCITYADEARREIGYRITAPPKPAPIVAGPLLGTASEAAAALGPSFTRRKRQGFFTRADLDAIAGKLPYHWRSFVWTFYFTGWRPKSEILTRRWTHVDLAGRWLRLDRGETKNGDGRTTPITDELYEHLVNQRAYCTDRERELGRIIPWVYFNPRTGARLTTYDRAWHEALKAAGYPPRILYDLRRTTTRSLARAGVPIKAAMAWVGHRDIRVHLRYGIVDEDMLREGAAKMARFEDVEREQPATLQRLSENRQ